MPISYDFPEGWRPLDVERIDVNVGERLVGTEVQPTVGLVIKPPGEAHYVITLTPEQAAVVGLDIAEALTLIDTPDKPLSWRALTDDPFDPCAPPGTDA